MLTVDELQKRLDDLLKERERMIRQYELEIAARSGQVELLRELIHDAQNEDTTQAA